MGVIHIKKKKGTSFLEIIIALSIIGIISAAVFNNIAFSLKVNKEINQKQTSSLLAQHVVEEIKNMGDASFNNLVKSMIDETTPEDVLNLFPVVKFDEINAGESKKKFQEGSEKIHSFKVFHKTGTDLYVKVSLPQIDNGLVNDYDGIGIEKVDSEWKDTKKCKLVMNITEAGDDYVVQVINNKNSTRIFDGLKHGLIFKISLEGSSLKLYILNDEIDEKIIYVKPIFDVLEDVNVYIKDITTEGLKYILSNDETSGLNLNLYMGKEATSEFILEGSNIRMFTEETKKLDEDGVIIDGENIMIDSVCNFTVGIYKEDKNNKYNNMIEIKGHKKFKRFN